MKSKITQDKLDSTIRHMLDEKVFVSYKLILCPACDGYSTKGHGGVYCLKCGTRMKQYPNMTWRTAIERTWEASGGSGVSNGFYMFVTKRLGFKSWGFLSGHDVRWNLKKIINEGKKK